MPIITTPSSSGNTPVVLLSGGTQGLGRALTELLLQQGFAVSLCARSTADVHEIQTTFAGHHQLLAFAGDVTDATFAERWVADTFARFGRINALVNNASTLGTVPMPSILDSTAENDVNVFAVNVIAPLRLIRLAARHLTRQHKSLVLGISSDAAIGGYPGWGIYGCSKAALDLLHKTLAAELVPTAVQVHAADPGDMDTAMHRTADPEAAGLPHPSVAAKALLPLFEALLPDRRFLHPNGSRLQVRDGQLEVSEA